jgi:hypothetical protein
MNPFKDNHGRNQCRQGESACRLSCAHDRSFEASDGGVFPARPRMYRQLLLAGRARTRALFTTGGSFEQRRSSVRAVPRKTRRNSVSWRVQRWSDRGRLPRRGVVLSGDSVAARANRSRAFEGWAAGGRCGLSSALAVAQRMLFSSTFTWRENGREKRADRAERRR